MAVRKLGVENMNDKLWLIYLDKVASDDIKSLGQLGLVELTQKEGIDLGLLGAEVSYESGPVVQGLLDLMQSASEIKQEERDEMDHFTKQGKEKEIFKLGLEFLQAAHDGRVDRVKELIDAEFPVDFQHPQRLTTALHEAASQSHSDVVRVLANSGACDYLLPDFRGRLAYNCAELFGRDPEIERLLLEKTKEQAQDDGVDLLKQQTELLKQWSKQRWFNALHEIEQMPTWKRSNQSGPVVSPSR